MGTGHRRTLPDVAGQRQLHAAPPRAVEASMSLRQCPEHFDDIHLLASNSATSLPPLRQLLDRSEVCARAPFAQSPRSRRARSDSRAPDRCNHQIHCRSLYPPLDKTDRGVRRSIARAIAHHVPARLISSPLRSTRFASHGDRVAARRARRLRGVRAVRPRCLTCSDRVHHYLYTVWSRCDRRRHDPELYAALPR